MGDVTACVLVDGKPVPELRDPEASGRDWDWLAGTVPAEELESIRRCPRQSQRLLASEAGNYFVLGLRNSTKNEVAADCYVDGECISRNLIKGTCVDDEVDLILIEGLMTPGSSKIRAMKFAPIATREPDTSSALVSRASQAGRVDVVFRPVMDVIRPACRFCGSPYCSDPYCGYCFEGDSDYSGPDSECGEFGEFGRYGYGGYDSEDDAIPAPRPPTRPDDKSAKKKVFGLEAAFDDAAVRGGIETEKVTVKVDAKVVLATYSFRYASIEGLHLTEATPGAWLEYHSTAIEAARSTDRALRLSLRSGYVISEPPSYLWSDKLWPLCGSGAPRALADAASLDGALRAEGFKLAGTPRSLFAALSHQLCGSAALAGYVERRICEELLTTELYGKYDGVRDYDGFLDLFRKAASPLKTYEAWIAHVRARRDAVGSESNQGPLADAGRDYAAASAREDGAPPLKVGDNVHVAATRPRPKHIYGPPGSRRYIYTVGDTAAYDSDDFDDPFDGAVVGVDDDGLSIVVKETGSSHAETLRRSSPRLGVGAKTDRGAAAAEAQPAVFAQAFADVFGVRLFLLLLAKDKKARKLRVIRVEPRAGARVLINGYAVAHLGGVAFDSIERHHDIIEIASDDDEEEEAPPPPPKKKYKRKVAPRAARERRGGKRVKSERVKSER